MMLYTHFFALVLALVVGAAKGVIDASIIKGGGKIRHGLHFVVWAVLLAAVVAGYAWGRPLDYATLGATVLSVWGLSALSFRTFLSAAAGWDWSYIGTTSAYDRLLLGLFGAFAGAVAAGVEFLVFIGGLVWLWSI